MIEAGASLPQIYERLSSKKIQTFSAIKHLTYSQEQAKQQKDGSIQFHLSISNESSSQISFNQAYPNISIPITQPFLYFLPANASIVSGQDISFEANYGGIMPFPFISLKSKNSRQGLLLAVKDARSGFKEFRFKMNKESIKISVIYYDMKLQPGQVIKLPSFVVIPFQVQANFVQESIQIYNNIIKDDLSTHNLQQISKFAGNFVLRVIELFEIEWNSVHKRADKLNPDNSVVLMVREDQKLIGPINFIHLRDWAANGDSLKTKFGNYLKNSITGPKVNSRWLKDQIRYLKNIKNVGVGLYVQGYLVSKLLFDKFNQDQFQQMEMKDLNSKPYTTWGSSSYHMCSSSNRWREMLASSIERVYKALQCDGFYIDQFGFGSRTSPYKICTNQLHNHLNFDLQVGEGETLKAIKEKINEPSVSLYIQQAPEHNSMKQINGSLSSAAKKASSREKEIPLLIYRFIHPRFKIYELITEYTMAKEDLLSNQKTVQQNIPFLKKCLMVSFWNGNGIYLPKNLNFYDKDILEMIKSLNYQFILNKDYFTGQDVIPLVNFDENLGVDQILMNQFSNKFGRSIFTLLNWSNEKQVLKFKGFDITMSPLSLGILEADYYLLVKI